MNRRELSTQLNEGQRRAKLTSRKQAITRGCWHGLITAVTLTLPIWFPFRIGLFVLGYLLYGAIASSDRFRNRL